TFSSETRFKARMAVFKTPGVRSLSARTSAPLRPSSSDLPHAAATSRRTSGSVSRRAFFNAAQARREEAAASCSAALRRVAALFDLSWSRVNQSMTARGTHTRNLQTCHARSWGFDFFTFLFWLASFPFVEHLQ